MTVLAIIPARGGSKRIPRKNLETVGGLSLVYRAIFCARGLRCIVATDDDEIAEHVNAFPHWTPRDDIGVCRLPAELCGDGAQIEPVLGYVIERHSASRAVNRHPDAPPGAYEADADTFVLLQPTSPLRTEAHVTAALKAIHASRSSGVVDAACLSVTHEPRVHEYFRGEDFDGDGWSMPHHAERPLTQTLGGLGHQNGAVYAFTRETWERTRCRTGDWDTDVRRVVMHWSEAVDVDTPEDLEAARRLMPRMGIAL